MKKKILRSLSCTIAFCAIGTLNGYAQLNKTYLDESQPIEVRIESALSQMTLEEKVALCHAQSKFSSKGVPRLGIPEVWMNDGPFGVRAEVLWDDWAVANVTNDSCTAFPALTCLAASFDPELAAMYGKALGEEARYRNKSVILGPGVNIYRTPFNGRNFEYMGEDPFLAATLVVPYIQSLQQNGVAACVKHYALNNQEVWRDSVNVQISDRALHEIYLPAFKAAVEKGKTWALMGAYNRYKYEFCCHNDILLNKILKLDWKFDGVVVSDWNGTHNTREAALKGLDIEMGTFTDGMSKTEINAYNNYYLASDFLRMLKDGEIDEEVVNDKARRILRLIFRTVMNTKRPFGSFASPEHFAISRHIAESGIVLLKNQNNLLPLDFAKIKTIAVIGENADRIHSNAGGASKLKAKYEITPLQALTKRWGDKVKITYTRGYGSYTPTFEGVIPSPYNADSLKNEALKVAANADVVLFFGGLNKNRHQDNEGFDRQSYDLPYGQPELLIELAKINKNIVFIIASGTATALPFEKDIPAIVQGWYGGSEAGNAIVSVLSGEVNPSGKLPFSYPKKLEDCGAHAFGEIAYPGIKNDQKYMEDILVGYRWLDTKKIKPLYAFGYGMSYTTFKYGKATTDRKEYTVADTATLTFTLTNTGEREGAEIAQVYISQPKASVMRPVKELKGFTKVKLQAGETKTVKIQLPVKEWAFYSETSQSWVVEPGEFVISLGASSDDIKHKCVVTIK